MLFYCLKCRKCRNCGKRFMKTNCKKQIKNNLELKM